MRNARFGIAFGLLAAVASGPAFAAPQPTSLAVLTMHLQNDHAEFVPTTDAERRRLDAIKQTFRAQLEQSGKYRFVDVPPPVQARIDKDQPMNDCADCAARYGKELGTQQVAWIEVQKVSDLILNINVYVKDVAANKMVFTKSVDVRGNTDESWDHSIKYLVKNYMVQPKA